MTVFDRDRERDRGYGDRFGGGGAAYPPQEPVCFSARKELKSFTFIAIHLGLRQGCRTSILWR